MSDLITELVNNAVLFLSSFGPIAGILLIYLESIIAILPLSVFIALNIITFGDIFGFFISLIATVLGCCSSFFFFRYFFSKRVRRFYKREKLDKIDELMKKISRISFVNLTVIMALPFTPAFLVNIAAGLSKCSFKKFFISCLIGKSFMVYFWGYVGTSLFESVTDITVLLKIGFMLLLSYTISKAVGKKFDI